MHVRVGVWVRVGGGGRGGGLTGLDWTELTDMTCSHAVLTPANANLLAGQAAYKEHAAQGGQLEGAVTRRSTSASSGGKGVEQTLEKV